VDDVELTWCTTSIPYDLNDYITGDAGGTWLLSPLSDPLPGGQTIDDVAPTGVVENLSDNSNHIFVFLYQVQAAVPSGFEQADCAACISVATITITTTTPFLIGNGDVFVVIPDNNGDFNLYDYLEGEVDTSGAWEQVIGDSVVVPGDGYLGSVNLDAVDGCHYRFRYHGGFIDDLGGDCRNEAFVDITIIRDFELEITQVGDVLTANYTGCPTPEFEWFIDTGGGFVTTGETTQDYTVCQRHTVFFWADTTPSSSLTYQSYINTGQCHILPQLPGGTW